MSHDTRDEEAIFAHALQVDSPAQRAAYLDQVCNGDGRLRRRMAALLQQHDQSAGLLDLPPPGIDDTSSLDDHFHEQVGSQIGPYRLMEQIGEGGMGLVYVAWQQRPMNRRVALKIIKPGLDTREVMARFEAERQALAMMDHPHIAKVLDAGTTESGRPYFAMELVRGIPLTDYSDRNRLRTRQRLALFVAACQAVQHAHQKGVIHRDLKPSNVLVTEMDGRPLPKVIDFGVAKAINQRLTERTIYTRHQQMIGTPLYMSPEQADLSALDVDTRSDIYSLGVLLYELLTGVPPFDQERFHSAGYDELRRIIREEEPPKPSTRISTLGDEASTITDLRQSDPKELRHQLRGELDWIVMKALDKDRNRRYETANALAADVQRYLRDEPVEACPPSRVYRFRKFARHHKRSLVTAAAIGLILMAALLVSGWQLNKVDGLVHNLHLELRERVLLAIMAGDEQQARQAIDRAEQAMISPEMISLFRGQLALYYGRIDEAIARLQAISDRSIAAQGMLSFACFQAADIAKMDPAVADLVTRLERAGNDLTFEDKLFAGHAMIANDMRKGLRLVEQALDERSNSPLAHMIHAYILTAVAHNTNDAEKLNRALREIREAKRYVGAVPGLVATRHTVQHVALVMGQGEVAGVDVDQLRSEWDTVRSLPSGRLGLIRLLAHLDHREVPDLIEETSSFADGELVFYVPILLQYWRADEVLDFIERRGEPGGYADCARARLMAVSPGRQTEAGSLCVAVVRQQTNAVPRAHCLNTLLLLGKEHQVRALADSCLDSSEAAARYAEEMLRFLAGRASQDDFVSAADLGVFRLEAWFTVAMLQRARGNTEAMREALQECIATGIVHNDDYWWARVLLEDREGLTGADEV